MSEVAGELARVRSAFEQPTLTLLHQRQAPVVIAVFRSAFGRDNRPIPTARLHAQVEDHLAELRLAGEAEVPTGSGRDLCQRWMRGQWLVRALDDTGQEVYTLTSHAQQALELVKTLSRDRATLSEHRIATILNTVRRFNSEANPDRSARVGILNAEIARLGAERDRLVDGEADGGALGGLHAGGVHRAPAADLRAAQRLRPRGGALRPDPRRDPGVVPVRGPARRRGDRRLPRPGRLADDGDPRGAGLRGRVRAAARRRHGRPAARRPGCPARPPARRRAAGRRRPGGAARHGAADPRRPGPGALAALPGHLDAQGLHRLPRRAPATASSSRPCARSSPS